MTPAIKMGNFVMPALTTMIGLDFGALVKHFFAQPGSCFIGDTNDKEDGFIGFQFIEVEFRQGGVGVKVWPYRLDKRDMNRFVPDTHRWHGQEGPFFELDTFKDKDESEKKKDKKRKTIPAPLKIPMQSHCRKLSITYWL